MADATQAPGDIGNVLIVPEAEGHTNGNANIAAQAEENFYKSAGIEAQLRHHQQHLGWLGKFFGANATAPTNIAGFVILISMFMIFVSFFITGNDELVETRKWLGNVVMTALGFIVGAATRK